MLKRLTISKQLTVFCQKTLWYIFAMVLNKRLNSAVFWTFVQKQPPELFNKKGVLRKSTKFTGKRLYQRLVFNKVASLRPATLLIKRIWHRCFPVNFVKFLRTPFLQNTSGWLLFFVDREWGLTIPLDCIPLDCKSSFLL